jgi:hypothetical protein
LKKGKVGVDAVLKIDKLKIRIAEVQDQYSRTGKEKYQQELAGLELQLRTLESSV